MYSMTYAVWRFQRVAALCTAAGFALMIAGLPALAQDKAPAPAAPGAAPAAPGAAPAAKDAGKDAKKSTQWVKLCDKITINAKPKEGAPPPAKDAKPATEDKQLCSTMFEAIESNTGQLIVSVGLQEIEGAPKQVLAVMVPLGVVIPGGVKLAVYSADQWAKAAKNETIELKDLKTVDLKFLALPADRLHRRDRGDERGQRLVEGQRRHGRARHLDQRTPVHGAGATQRLRRWR